MLGPFRTITLHFEVLKLFLLSFAQDWQMSSRVWAFSGHSVISTKSSSNPRAAIWMSPTLTPKLEEFNVSKRSLIKIMKRTGPNLLPCKTPRFMSSWGEKNLSIRTSARFEENKFLMTLNILPLTPALNSFVNSSLRHTVSKAFLGQGSRGKVVF